MFIEQRHARGQTKLQFVSAGSCERSKTIVISFCIAHRVHQQTVQIDFFKLTAQLALPANQYCCSRAQA